MKYINSYLFINISIFCIFKNNSFKNILTSNVDHGNDHDLQ
jgi:hypothetical protein